MPEPVILLGGDVCGNLDEALAREWLVANGLGGYASGTVGGAHTRRYHGLLVAALRPPGQRTVLLSKIEEQAILGQSSYFLSTNEYQDGTVYPSGYRTIDHFRLELGLPVWSFRVGSARLEKRVWMEHRANTTYLMYTLLDAPEPLHLSLLLLCNYRDYHGETRGAEDWHFQVREIRGGLEVRAYDGAIPYWIAAGPRATYHPAGFWYWRFAYRRERERGLPYLEDLYAPGSLELSLRPGESVTVMATCEGPPSAVDGRSALNREVSRRRSLLEMAGAAEDSGFRAHLVLAADQFVVHPAASDEASRGGQASAPGPAERDHGLSLDRAPAIVAGYHWFSVWGRDTMVSLPGILLETGRGALARQVLEQQVTLLWDGLLPRVFDEEGRADYASADTTLWFFQAIHQYVVRTGDTSLLDDLFDTLVVIITRHMEGTHFGIRMDPSDSLLVQGEPGLALTWMDAKWADWVVTPRMGKAVEVQALWYNALRLMADWASRLGQPQFPYEEHAAEVSKSFQEKFWYHAGGYLYDVVDTPNGPDASLRPNQIFAISLPYPLLKGQRARRVLEVVSRSLATPYGLRTLAPEWKGYTGRFTGDRWQRDTAYHQGTVWPWLIGPMADAELRLLGKADRTRSMLTALAEHLREAGLGTISEVFDGDPPHLPGGAISQAWSVGEVLRVLGMTGPTGGGS